MMFHVKPNNFMPLFLTVRSFMVAFGIGAIYLSAAPAYAAINKCTSADGKVVFSDQLCVTGQGAATVKPTAEAPAFKGSLADKQAKCKKLTMDFGLAMDGRNNAIKTEADLSVLMDTIHTQCKGVQQPEELEEAKRPKRKYAVSKNPQVIDAQCVAEAALIEKQNSAQTILSYSERRALTQSEAEFAKRCEYK
jgi:hypothetical protein